jgi:hypothetical protein
MNVEGKVRPRRGHDDLMGQSSTLSLISALVGGGWLTPRYGRFTLGKEAVAIV